MDAPSQASGTVLVLGSINVDLLVSAPRLPLAGETVAGHGISRELGGKGANQAVGAARAGARCRLAAAVGADEDGRAMKAALETFGVDVGMVRATAGSTTGCAIVATSPQDNQIICIAGANATVDESLVAAISIGTNDVCLAQMETPAPATRAFFARAQDAGAQTILNAAPADLAALSLLPLCDVLVVNESELAVLAKRPDLAPDDDAVLLFCTQSLGMRADQILVVTLGSAGLAIVHNQTVRRIAGHRVPVTDTTGAGDCFCGYLAAGLARGDTIERAAAEANRAASLAVQASGAACAIPPREAVLAGAALA